MFFLPTSLVRFPADKGRCHFHVSNLCMQGLGLLRWVFIFSLSLSCASASCLFFLCVLFVGSFPTVRFCTPDVELLSVTRHSFYLPREFPKLFITLLYIHPKTLLWVIFNVANQGSHCVLLNVWHWEMSGSFLCVYSGGF